MKKRMRGINCCMKISTIWLKRPISDIVCSMQVNKDICNAEMLILRATASSRCMKQSVIEVHNLLKNAPNKNKLVIPKKKIPKYSRIFHNLPIIKKGIKLPREVKKGLKLIQGLGKLLDKKYGPFNPKSLKKNPLMKKLAGKKFKKGKKGKGKKKKDKKNKKKISDHRRKFDMDKLINRIKNKKDVKKLNTKYGNKAKKLKNKIKSLKKAKIFVKSLCKKGILNNIILNKFGKPTFKKDPKTKKPIIPKGVTITPKGVIKVNGKPITNKTFQPPKGLKITKGGKLDFKKDCFGKYKLPKGYIPGSNGKPVFVGNKVKKTKDGALILPKGVILNKLGKPEFQVPPICLSKDKNGKMIIPRGILKTPNGTPIFPKILPIDKKIGIIWPKGTYIDSDGRFVWPNYVKIDKENNPIWPENMKWTIDCQPIYPKDVFFGKDGKPILPTV
jgi:hypothetical protein